MHDFLCLPIASKLLYCLCCKVCICIIMYNYIFYYSCSKYDFFQIIHSEKILKPEKVFQCLLLICSSVHSFFITRPDSALPIASIHPQHYPFFLLVSIKDLFWTSTCFHFPFLVIIKKTYSINL